MHQRKTLKKIIVSVTNDLNTDQRVAKVCSTLSKNGFKVILIGRKLKSSAALKRNYKTFRFNLWFHKGPLFYTEYNLRLFFKLLFLKKDILLSNDLDTLLANYIISKIQRKSLVYDSHELFPEIPELVNKPSVKNIWSSLEHKLLPKLKNCYTVCDSISNFYKEKYNTNFKTIKNLPTYKTHQKERFPFDKKDKKIILYQGALNIGRGLELMIETMTYLENHILVLIGSGDITEDLKKQVCLKNIEEKVIFLGKIEPKKLSNLTPNADIGISLEEDLGLNYRFALPNKIFDYIQAEVPILVSNLPEMKQVVLDHKVGDIIEKRNATSLAIQIQKMHEIDYTSFLKKAKKELIWEHQEKELLAIFSNL